MPSRDPFPTAATLGGLRWNSAVDQTAKATIGYDKAEAHHGYASLKIDYTAGSGNAGVTNRGIGNEGLFLQSGMEYEGYFFAKASKSSKMVVMLRNWETKAVLATQEVVVDPSTNWTQYSFTMTASNSTSCDGIKPGSDPEVSCNTQRRGMAVPPNTEQGHICIKCGGEFVIALSEPGIVHVDYVYLQPGAAGRFGAGPFFKDGVQVLKDMGITAIRLGGSFTDPSYYFWKKWRGLPWERESLGAKWGSELVSGFGPFEFIDMCVEAGIEPIVTTTAQWGDEMGQSADVTCCSPDDMADLVEYAYGNETTMWGKMRIADGHPTPYNFRYIELGNEQYNTLYPAQVKAMEERATQLGKPKFFYYMSPNNANWLNASQSAEVEALGLGDHVVSDMHVGAGGGVERATQLFSKFPTMTMGAVNAETNDGSHTMTRAAKEAEDLNAWFNAGATSVGKRLKFRTASFCNERSGHFDAFDQGISFFLPNMTWIQPPGYVHKMFHETWQPHGLAVNITAGGEPAQSDCDYYAFWTDKGCRTWSLPENDACSIAHASIATLYKRTAGTNNFTLVEKGAYCSQQADFQDGPAAPESDSICRQHCLNGDKAGTTGAGVTVSAQQSDDGQQIVVRIANTGTDSASIHVNFSGKMGFLKDPSATVWKLGSADPLAANTPARPTAVAPVKAGVGVTLRKPIVVPPISVAVLVVE